MTRAPFKQRYKFFPLIQQTSLGFVALIEKICNGEPDAVFANNYCFQITKKKVRCVPFF
jgi:hypothetical protein